MTESQIRIIRDIKFFKEQNYEDKFIYFDKSNFMNIYLLIIGPKGTPYEDGFLLFKIIFSNEYPYIPPKVDFLNKNKRIRIHPNLYSCGKVCLSILGTWDGPEWKASMSLNTISLSLQSLLNENPLNNEPGYVDYDLSNQNCKDYLIYCIYHKYKLLLEDVILNKFEGCDFFKDIIKKTFEKNKKNLNNNLLSYKTIYGEYKIKKKSYYSMCNNVNFETINIEKYYLKN